MIRSIQYFNEKSVAIFENLEDEFIKNPVDIASYVLKVTEELHKTGLRMIEETLNTLDEMLNESDMRQRQWVVDRHETKQLITSLGCVTYNKTLFKNKKDGHRSYLLDEIMGLESHERITEDAEARLLTEAVQTSYRRGGEEVSLLDSVTKQTVKNKIHKLSFPPEDEGLEEKKHVKCLYIDADEDHVALQFQNKKGDLRSIGTNRKNNCVIEKLVYVYEGLESESEGSKRLRLINPHYFCSDSLSEDNTAFGERIFSCIDCHYDLDSIEKVYLNGDGGAWIAAGKSVFPGIIVTMDEFHMQKYLSKIVNHLMDSRGDALHELRTIIMRKGKKEFNSCVDNIKTYVKNENEQQHKGIEEGREYILNNWMACKLRLANRRSLPGCSAEGHVSHVLSARMSSRPMGWSRQGAGQMGRLRAYYYNGGNMLELVRYQREELKMASGFEGVYCSPTKIMCSEKNRHYELGKYMESLRGSVPMSIKKKLYFSKHILGLT